ncbi:MAG: hypothetical protein AAGI08_06650 [Bacteroidota bacterium]
MLRLLISLFVLPLSACTSASVLTFSDLNETGVPGSHFVTLQFENGASFRAQDPFVARDSVFWQDPRTSMEHAAPLSALSDIKIAEHERGATQGLRWGTIVGAAIGLTISLMALENDSGIEGAAGSAALVVSGAAIGGLSGAVFGAAVGHRHRFIIFDE